MVFYEEDEKDEQYEFCYNNNNINNTLKRI